MNREEAEEYTQSLGQIVAGSWRQILWAENQGIPKALGLSTREWVERRLGGYVKMAIPERREVAKELAANGHSTREIADVVGVKHPQVIRDLKAGTKVPSTPQPDVQHPNSNGFAGTNVPDAPQEKSQAHQQELERQRRVALARNLADVNLLRTELISEAHIDAVVELLRDFPDVFEHETRMSPRVFLQALEDVSTKVTIIRQKAGVT